MKNHFSNSQVNLIISRAAWAKTFLSLKKKKKPLINGQVVSEFIKFTGNGDGREAGRPVGFIWCGAYISWEVELKFQHGPNMLQPFKNWDGLRCAQLEIPTRAQVCYNSLSNIYLVQPFLFNIKITIDNLLLLSAMIIFKIGDKIILKQTKKWR